MRLWILVPLAAAVALGGCGEGEQKSKAAARPQAFQAGQWQSSLEVTNFRRMDQGQPRLNMPMGTRVSGGACLAPADVSRPPPGLFVGSDFTDCQYSDNFYLRNGRMIASATCQRQGVGPVEVTLNIDFTDGGYEGTVEFATRLVSDGDVLVATRARGQRSGQCTPAAEGSNQTQAR
jgi:hypothetical protein